jgi:hypothetical protein
MNELDLPPFLQDRVLPAEEALERTVPSGTHLASGVATSEPHSFYASLWDHVREHDLTGLTITQALFLHPHPLLVGRAMEIGRRPRRRSRPSAPRSSRNCGAPSTAPWARWRR